MRATVLLAGILPMLVAWAAARAFGDVQHVQPPLHEALELAGTFIAIAVAALLLLRQQYSDRSPHLFWMVMGLVAMGVVDGVHSQAPMGAAFSWTRHSATLLGGLTCSLVWLEPPAALLRRKYSCAVVVALTALASALSIWQWPQALPAPWVAGRYSSAVIATNALGGLGFLAAAGYFARRYRRAPSAKDLAFFGMTLLFAVAALMFGLSHVWAADWWAWHVFRLIAYAILLQVAYQLLVALFANARQRADQAIRHLASIVESSDDAIIGKGTDGTILSWNKGAERLYGYGADEIVGKSIKTLARPQDHAQIDAVLLRIAGGERVLHFEARRMRKDGTEVSVSINVSPIVDAAGNVIAASTIARDVTENKRVQTELRSIEWMLSRRAEPTTAPALQPYGDLTALNTGRTILDAVGKDLLHDVVSDYMDLLETSSAIYEKNGDYAYGIFTSGWCQAMDYASYRGCVAGDAREALACGRWHCHESCWNEASRKSMEIRGPTDIACAGGIRLHAVPIFAGDEIIGSINFGYGSPPRAEARLAELAAKYGITVDELRRNAAEYRERPAFIIELAKRRLQGSARLIGEIVQRKRAQEALRAQGQELRLIMDATPALISYIDARYRYRRVNRSYERWFGRTREQVEGREVSEVLGTAASEAVRPFMERALAGETVSFERRLPYSDGGTRWVDVSYTPDRAASGAVRGFVVHVMDISARKQAEDDVRTLNVELEERVRARTAQLEAANKDLEGFSYSVSHDLRVPLRAIDGFSHMLESEYAAQLDQEGRRLLSVVRGGAQRMGQLIDDVLAFSRISRRDMDPRPVDMSALVQDAIGELATQREGRRLDLRIGALPLARGDAAMLRQVWVNLFANAIKFSSPRAMAHIDVGGRQDAEEAVYWVKDDGVGFDMQYAGKLFGVFQRLHAVDEFEGTGTGLAIVKRVVQRHGGRVWAEGKVNEGATFWFALPVAAVLSRTTVIARKETVQ